LIRATTPKYLAWPSGFCPLVWLVLILSCSVQSGYAKFALNYNDNTTMILDHVVYVSSSTRDGRVIGEYGASTSTVIAERIWMTPEVSGGDLFGGDDGTGGYAPIAVVAGTTLSWVHGNHLGVPAVYTSSTGAVIAAPAYALPGFPGQFRTLADIYYNKYRDYDISTGRYIQADPIGLGGGTSPYLYAAGNPVRYTDASGLIVDTLADAGFIGYDLYRLYTDNVRGNGKRGSLGTNLTALGLDVAGAAIPGITGLGPASRVANRAQTVEQAGADLAQKIGTNRVSVMTPSGRMHIDLAGDAHFEKSLVADIPTPHVKFQELNFGPNGKSNLSPGATRPATMMDIRTARKISERRGQ
jgi:RHS repeat-associated protein